jgi:hypothetical protein
MNDLNIYTSKIYSYKDIEQLKLKISNIDNTHHVFILKILKDNEIEYSENKNGCFVNMLNIPNNILSKIEQYVDFINEKYNNEIQYEKLKESIKHNITI